MRARVVATFGRQSLIDDDGRVLQATRRGRRSDAVVGDWVQASHTADGQASIDSIEPRATLLFRADANRVKELAANIDQVIVVFAARPAFDRNFVWRALVAAAAASIEVLVLRNKADLADTAGAEPFLQQIERLGWRTVSISAKGEPAAARTQLLREAGGRKSLLVGQSGMGKSTLINLLVADAGVRTQEYSQRLNVGKQTTTASRWFTFGNEIAGAGLTDSALVDTPGFRNFGLAHLTLKQIAETFPEFVPHLGDCRFADCRHLEEPGCAIVAALNDGSLAQERYRFYRSLAAERR